MASVITPPASTRVTPHVSEAAARHEGPKAARRLASRPISILGVWRDALATFSAHSVAVLLCALFGFAVPAIIGQWIAMQAALGDYAWVGPVVTLSERPSVAMLLVLTVFGLFGSSFARGVVTWLALTNMRRTCSEAIRVTFARYPALLAGSLVYGAFALACMLCINSLTQVLQPKAGEAKVLPTWSGLPRAWGDISHQLVGQGIDLLKFNLGSPFAESLLTLYFSAIRQATPLIEYERWLVETQGASALAQLQQQRAAQTSPFEQWLAEVQSENAVAPLSPPPVPAQPIQSLPSPQPHRMRLIALASLALLLLAEPLLRFRTVMAFKPSRSRQVPELPGGVGPRRFAAFAPLFDGARFGLRHFGVVTLHIWVVRIAIFTLCLGLVEFPLALMDNVIMPNVIAFIGKSQLLPVLNFAQVSASALVSAIMLAFGAIYDARLYVALSGYDVMPDVVRKVPSAELATDPPM